MAVPKKKKSYTKKSISYNIWKNKKIIYQNFVICSNCLFIKKTGFGCNNCKSF